MNYQTLNLIAIILLAMCGLFLIISIMLFIRFKIIKLIGDLTGANARKAIQQMRLQNLKTGEKSYQTSQINKNRGTITEKISPSGRLGARQTGKLRKTDELFKKAENESQNADNNHKFIANETTVISSNETSVLEKNNNETTLLSQENNPYPVKFIDKQYFFSIEVDKILVHTSEVI